MRQGGFTRLVHRLGVIVLILELTHVPLPLPVHTPAPRGPAADRSRSACDLASGLHWRWAPIEEEDDLDADLAPEGDAEAACDCRPSADTHLTAPQRVRHNRHFLRGHSSKHLAKHFAGRPLGFEAATLGEAGFHPTPDVLARTPRGAMLQRWRC